jgi:Flp pilus assembly protein TadD
MRRFLVAFAAVLLVAAGTVSGKDVYKAFLSPEVPHHRAIKEILAQIEANPLDASLFNDLGCLVAWDGFWRDALRNFETAAKLDKGDTRPMFNAGIVYAYKGEWGNARSAFEKAVKRGPGNWAGWWMLGYAEEQLGNTEAAVDAYRRSLRMDTSLFDLKQNPFAANSRLKAIVLTATYDKRLARAAMPRAEEFADENRIAALLQPGKAAQRAAAPTSPEEAAPPAATGPVITNVPSSAAAAPRGGSSAPASSSPYRAQPAPAREPAEATSVEPAAEGASRRKAGQGRSESSPTTPRSPAGAPRTAPGAPQTSPGAPAPVPTAVVPGPGTGA